MFSALANLRSGQFKAAKADYGKAITLDSELSDVDFERDINQALGISVQNGDPANRESFPKRISQKQRGEIKRNLMVIRSFCIFLTFVIPIIFLLVWKNSVVFLNNEIASFKSTALGLYDVSLTISIAFVPLIFLMKKVGEHWTDERHKYVSYIDTGRMFHQSHQRTNIYPESDDQQRLRAVASVIRASDRDFVDYFSN